jgi:hypothetical protein
VDYHTPDLTLFIPPGVDTTRLDSIRLDTYLDGVYPSTVAYQTNNTTWAYPSPQTAVPNLDAYDSTVHTLAKWNRRVRVHKDIFPFPVDTDISIYTYILNTNNNAFKQNTNSFKQYTNSWALLLLLLLIYFFFFCGWPFLLPLCSPPVPSTPRLFPRAPPFVGSQNGRKL